MRPVVAVIAIPYGALGLALLVRDEIIQPANAARWKLPYLAAQVPVWAWAVLAFAATLLVAMEGAFRIVRKLSLEVSALREARRPALAVVDTQRQAFRGERGPTHEFHRIVVENQGGATIDDVRATVRLINGQEFVPGPLRLHEMHDNDLARRAPVRLQHGGRAVFDVARYEYKHDRFEITDHNMELTYAHHVMTSGTRLEVAISGDGTVVVWCGVLIGGEAGNPLRLQILPPLDAVS